ncbi:MAG TPA: ABC-F family ATP-binding cassette domain-containing protein [Gemmatimonadota bacterium]|nr:ABC-F family ATP-binding cassette domain-containing protein [Gemmatimonadota bacterium]
MITVSNLSKSFGDQTLFSGVSLQLSEGSRYGLVGANGSGKSTLLRILAGETPPSEGTVSIPRRARLGVLRQDHFEYEAVPILDVVLMGNRELWDALVVKQEVLERAADHFDSERYSAAEEVVLRHDGYSVEARAAEILEGLGIPTAVHREPLATLSGGFKLRVLLAQTLAADPDVLLLDEPTNHLDILSIRWFEKFLQGFEGTAVVISHDHRFLDNVSTHILDVDYETVTLYAGGYTRFQAAKREERERKETEITRREREIADHQAFVDRFRAKASKARQAQSRIKRIEKIEIERLPQSSRRWPTFRFRQRRPSGKVALTARGISKAFGDRQVLSDVNLEVKRGDRLAVLGPNGIGKSTLLKILVGQLEPDAGEVEWGYETYPGWFAQDHREQLGDGRQTAESWLWDASPGEGIGFVRGQLGLVLFSGDEALKPVGKLSGGEAARLVFARLAVEKPNVLVLDEPTNHLDLEAIESLVEGLAAFDGTAILVSHDRWFVSEVADRILEIRPDGIRDFHGSYDQYVEVCGDDHLDAESVSSRALRERTARERPARAPEGAPADRAAERERRRRAADLSAERDRLLEEVDQAEARLAEIHARFADPGFYAGTEHEDVRALESEEREVAGRVERLMEQWTAVERELTALGGEAAGTRVR